MTTIRQTHLRSKLASGTPIESNEKTKTYVHVTVEQGCFSCICVKRSASQKSCFVFYTKNVATQVLCRLFTSANITLRQRINPFLWRNIVFDAKVGFVREELCPLSSGTENTKQTLSFDAKKNWAKNTKTLFCGRRQFSRFSSDHLCQCYKFILLLFARILSYRFWICIYLISCCLLAEWQIA